METPMPRTGKGDQKKPMVRPPTEGASSSRYRGLLCAKATLFTFYASSFSTLLPGNDGTITMVTAMAPEGPEYLLFRVGI